MVKIAAVLSAVLSFAAVAQQPAPLVSPEVEASRVTFRLRAPQAKEVVLRGQWSKAPVPMTRDAAGVWSATIEPIPTDIWEYSFVVDGLNVLDPLNGSFKPQREGQKSIVHVPSNPPAPWDWRDVPHGTVHTHGYVAKTLGRARELRVYTPPGYERSGGRKFPLLVLQHGSGDNQRTWVEHGKAHWILDSLIADGKARPMIVVMLDGHPLGATPRGDEAKRNAALEAFRRELFDDALPLVESLYRVESDPAQRAIAGLSMGGAQATAIGLGDLGCFGAVGCFSGGASDPVKAKFLADPAAANATLRLLWIGIGKDDPGRMRAEEFVAALKEKGIRHTWVLSAGDHSWPVWRRYLAEFAPLLFADAK